MSKKEKKQAKKAAKNNATAVVTDSTSTDCK